MLNPADYLTRGIKLVEILNLKSWWEGPVYLREDESLWPKNIVEKEPFNGLKEVKMKNNSRVRRFRQNNVIQVCGNVSEFKSR